MNDTRRPATGDNRDARLGAALRANLARRKEQARGRAASEAEAPLPSTAPRDTHGRPLPAEGPDAPSCPPGPTPRPTASSED